MFKTFLFGWISGIAAATALAFSVPVVDLHREASLISVRPNGGNLEKFQINLPGDRILAGAQQGDKIEAFPKAVAWPELTEFDGLETEVFILRNTNDAVVGLAARINNPLETSGAFIQWMVHLPSRGTMFASMNATLNEEGVRNGKLVVGTREFETLSGTLHEFYNASVTRDDIDSGGRLELTAALVGPGGESE